MKEGSVEMEVYIMPSMMDEILIYNTDNIHSYFDCAVIRTRMLRCSFFCLIYYLDAVG